MMLYIRSLLSIHPAVCFKHELELVIAESPAQGFKINKYKS